MIDDDIGNRQRSRTLLPWSLAIGALMFALGMLFSPWFEENVRSQLPGALYQPDVGAVAAAINRQSRALGALEARVVALETRPATTATSVSAGGTPALNDPAAVTSAGGVAEGAGGGVTARIAALDRNQAQTGTRVDNLSAEIASINVKIDAVGSSAAASIATAETSAGKARGVLLVTAARRAAEQGQSLAVLEPALRRQFAAENAAAVDKLLAASRGAPTLDMLRQTFARIRPVLAARAKPGDAGWWQSLKSSIAGVVDIRREGSSAEGDADAVRLAEMSARLKRGDVTGALLILRRLPLAVQRAARQWRLDAEAYATTYGALQQLEAAVLLDDADLPMTAGPSETSDRF